MKLIILASLVLIASCAATALSQQPGIGRDDAAQIQWNSHQMNQPAPPRYNLSQERLEDIRRLYDQAVEQTRTRKPQDAHEHIQKQ